MSSIRRLAPEICPDCNATATLYVAKDRRLTCRLCGYSAGQENNRPQPPPRQSLEERYVINYQMPLTPDVGRWGQAIYHTAIDQLRRGNYDEALASFERAIDQQPNFIEAHLWAARLSDDPEARHHHYSVVVVHAPGNAEAIRELMVLKGEMTREEADRAADASSETQVKESGVPVEADLIEVACSNCGGTLTARPNQSEVQCDFCGHVEQITSETGYGLQSLAVELIKDRGKGVKWKVGSHLLRCNNCGAERVLTQRKLASECPFCGSRQIVRADALDSFRQPDGVVPFQISYKQADHLLHEQLNSLAERFKGFFVNNDVERIRMTPVYVPFWLFDIIAKVTLTKEKRQTRNWRRAPEVRRVKLNEASNNLPVAGVNSPPPVLTDRLKRFDTTAVTPYDPRMLAKVEAEIYTIDYDKAALKARRLFREYLEFRHVTGAFSEEEITMSYLVQTVTFRLVLMPVWVAVITEKDADIRLALIHGQRGQVLLGKARQPEHA